jgi:hypothetical protein
LLAINRHEIRKVVLALLVRGANRIERLEQWLEREGVDAGVDLCDLALGVGGVALLDDLSDAAPRGRAAANDAPVTEGTREFRCDNGGGGARFGVGVQQRAQRIDGQERRVARKQHHRSRLALEHGPRLQQRVAGSQLLFLGRKMHGSGETCRHELSYRALEHLGTVANDDGDAGGGQSGGGAEDALDDRQAGYRVEHLRQLRLHARAFASGQYDNVRVWPIDQF